MRKGKIVFIGLLLAANFLLIDFPGAKIVVYGIFVLLIMLNLYTKKVKETFAVKRYMETNRVFSGLSETNSLIVSNNYFLPIHAIQLTDYTDLNVSSQTAHYFLFGFDGEDRELVDYPIFGRKRGKFKIGPTVIKFADPLGINSFEVELQTTKEIIVFPNILQVNNMSYKSMQPYGAIRNKTPIFEDPTLIIGLKEYQVGDEIKKINWKVSAKHGKLLVNTYQPAISSGSVIILDLADDDYNFRSRDYYMEQAIEVAASLVRELYVLRQEVGIASNCRIETIDSILKTEVTKGEAHFTSILTDLALIEPCQKMPLRNVLDPSLLSLSWGTSIYMITPNLDEISLYKLIDFYQKGHAVTIINIGPEIKKDLSLWNIGFQSFYAEINGNIVNLMRI